MKKQILLPVIALMGVQAASINASAQQRQPRPGPGSGVQCWINADGKQQCQGGDYITPPDDNNRPRPRPDDGVRPPRPRPDDDWNRPRPPRPEPDPYYPPYNPQPSEPYYPPSAPSEPYYPPYTPPQDPNPPYYPPSQPPYNPGVPASYAIQAYQNEEQQAIQWQQRYAQAPSNSWDERYARDQRDQAISRALSNLQDPRAFETMSFQSVEIFADGEYRKYAQAASGSALENMYRQSANISYAGLDRALQMEVQRLSYDWRQLEVLANDLYTKYAQANSGSLKEQAYLRATRQAYASLEPAVQNEINRAYDFRQVEQIADYFYRVYQQANSGSLKEQTAGRINRQAYSSAVSKFQAQAYSMPQQQLYQIQDEYHRRYQQASSGSAAENYARQIRDIARSLLGVR